MIEALPLAVTTYDLSVFLHITAVMVGFGATIVGAITGLLLVVVVYLMVVKPGA